MATSVSAARNDDPNLVGEPTAPPGAGPWRWVLRAAVVIGLGPIAVLAIAGFNELSRALHLPAWPTWPGGASGLALLAAVPRRDRGQRRPRRDLHPPRRARSGPQDQRLPRPRPGLAPTTRPDRDHPSPRNTTRHLTWPPRHAPESAPRRLLRSSDTPRAGRRPRQLPGEPPAPVPGLHLPRRRQAGAVVVHRHRRHHQRQRPRSPRLDPRSGRRRRIVRRSAGGRRRPLPTRRRTARPDLAGRHRRQHQRTHRGRTALAQGHVPTPCRVPHQPEPHLTVLLLPDRLSCGNAVRVGYHSSKQPDVRLFRRWCMTIRSP